MSEAAVQSTLDKRDGLSPKGIVPLRAVSRSSQSNLLRAHFGEINIVLLDKNSRLKHVPLNRNSRLKSIPLTKS